MDVRVATGCSVPKENVLLYAQYSLYKVRLDVKENKNNGVRIFDMTNGRKTCTVIYLKNGNIILTNVSYDIIYKRMNEIPVDEDEQEGEK